MRKTLFSVLSLLVFFGPVRPGFLFTAADFVPSSSRVEASEIRDANPAVSRLRARITEAHRALEQLPEGPNDRVALAVGDAEGSGVETLDISKEDFLRKDAVVSVVSSSGATLRVRVVRPNYVNTAVRVTDDAGGELQPLVVRYPVERDGSLSEVAYYTSAHPAVESADVVSAGGEYVRASLAEAAAQLAKDGDRISPDIVDVAEHLCLVEHTDHKRFLTEDASSIFKDIQATYALNSGDAFRYSISTAGAGGMIQMIPKTYEGVRREHPEAGLNPDFVEGMRDHSNALRAMLLYMNDTWETLRKSDEVNSALDAGRATEAELLAAGYNSNPLRLPKYLKSGGDNWRALIPEETKMYLRIYSAVDGDVDFKNLS
ncbi:MAG TPA: hypothetical protein VLJ61_03050 [Pyrinomonadaceae bacterium]|nr:hypothetical protein [Pyrinomonadaceae bacterium]